VIGDRYPTIAAAAPQIADPLVRNLGTIGGSIAHADPSGDLPSVMLALDASVILTSTGGEREVPITEFLVGTFQTSIAPNEMLTEVRVPEPGPSAGGTYLKLERKIGDYATVGAAVFLSLSNGTIDRAGIGLTSVGLASLKATDAEASLAGKAPDDEAFAEAARLAAAAANPSDDVRGSAEYKRHMVDVYVRRGLATAAEMAMAA
jgi:carbon-monoxide dehydrogenase medium subunit